MFRLVLSYTRFSRFYEIAMYCTDQAKALYLRQSGVATLQAERVGRPGTDERWTPAVDSPSADYDRPQDAAGHIA